MLIKKEIFKFPLFNIPFCKIKSLESFEHKYICCSTVSIKPFINLEQYLVQFHTIFDNEIKESQSLSEEKTLFGGVIAEGLTIRGNSKCIKIDEFNIEIVKDDLPNLKYSPTNIYSNNGQWFYTENGNYQILSSKKIQYEKVKHLEGLEIYGDNILRLRTVVELLKMNVDLGKIKLTFEEYVNIGLIVLKSDPKMSIFDDETIIDGVTNWIPSMLAMPLYSKIPIEIRGKIV